MKQAKAYQTFKEKKRRIMRLSSNIDKWIKWLSMDNKCLCSATIRTKTLIRASFLNPRNNLSQSIPLTKALITASKLLISFINIEYFFKVSNLGNSSRNRVLPSSKWSSLLSNLSSLLWYPSYQKPLPNKARKGKVNSRP